MAFCLFKIYYTSIQFFVLTINQGLCVLGSDYALGLAGFLGLCENVLDRIVDVVNLLKNLVLIVGAVNLCCRVDYAAAVDNEVGCVEAYV